MNTALLATLGFWCTQEFNPTSKTPAWMRFGRNGEPMADTEHTCTCDDCGRPYGDEHGFPDLVIPNDAWRRISPTGDNGGILCPSCICARLHKAGISEVAGSFMSGPIKSVDSTLMHTLRWMENLREQGHGWGCPACGGWREKGEEIRQQSLLDEANEKEPVS